MSRHRFVRNLDLDGESLVFIDGKQSIADESPSDELDDGDEEVGMSAEEAGMYHLYVSSSST